MKGKIQKGLTLLLMGMLIFSSVFAGNTTEFKDVATDHWAKEAIDQMVKDQVIDGYSDGTFKPNKAVQRDEFAKMMVKNLGLSINHNASSSFDDMDDDYWAVPYVEEAKYYLTGYKSGSKVLFKPKEEAQREDMAVALVKALGYENESYDLDDLNIFEDEEQISPQLRKYVAIALKKGIMNGTEENGKRYFKGQKSLTRAESAVLLYSVKEDKVILSTEEKIIFDDKLVENSTDTPESVSEEKNTKHYPEPNVSVKNMDGKVIVSWDKITSPYFKGYKVVASKSNSRPEYSADGYFRYITNKNTTSETIYLGATYNGGDIVKFESGETYYFSVTALYDDRKVAGNAVRVTMSGDKVEKEESKTQPTSDYVRPTLAVKEVEGELKLQWNPINHEKFSGYKVVASKKDSTPSYPDNGYRKWITDKSTTSTYIGAGDSYNGGDVGTFQGGETYYFAITVLYDDGTKLTSNVVTYKMPGKTTTKPETKKEESETNGYTAPKLVVNSVDGKLKLTWDQISHGNLNGYKVVASLGDSSPIYPENGYHVWITDKTKTTDYIKAGDGYKNGDFKYFESGKTYYFSITAVYSDKKVAGNVVKVTMP